MMSLLHHTIQYPLHANKVLHHDYITLLAMMSLLHHTTQYPPCVCVPSSSSGAEEAEEGTKRAAGMDLRPFPRPVCSLQVVSVVQSEL